MGPSEPRKSKNPKNEGQKSGFWIALFGTLAKKASKRGYFLYGFWVPSHLEDLRISKCPKNEVIFGANFGVKIEVPKMGSKMGVKNEQKKELKKGAILGSPKNTKKYPKKGTILGISKRAQKKGPKKRFFFCTRGGTQVNSQNALFLNKRSKKGQKSPFFRDFLKKNVILRAFLSV